MMNIQRKILSMTIATYFQSSFTWEHRGTVATSDPKTFVKHQTRSEHSTATLKTHPESSLSSSVTDAQLDFIWYLVGGTEKSRCVRGRECTILASVTSAVIFYWAKRRIPCRQHSAEAMPAKWALQLHPHYLPCGLLGSAFKSQLCKMRNEAYAAECVFSQ